MTLAIRLRGVAAQRVSVHTGRRAMDMRAIMMAWMRDAVC